VRFEIATAEAAGFVALPAAALPDGAVVTAAEAAGAVVAAAAAVGGAVVAAPAGLVATLGVFVALARAAACGEQEWQRHQARRQ